MSTKFRMVCATRHTVESFQTDSALGQSLALGEYPGTELRLFPNNTAGLPANYNVALREAAADPAVLIFVHDDVYLCDFFWQTHVLASLEKFDILGLAGNRRRLPRQANWVYVDDKETADEIQNLSGAVAHGLMFPSNNVCLYGPADQEVKLLDGVMLIARSETLISNEVFFDERFDFHHYDMDFCRTAEARNLRIGTTTVSVVHESEGNFKSDAWHRSYAKYLDKWKT